MQTYLPNGDTTDLEAAQLLEIGAVLKEARTQKALSVEEIRKVTCIPTYHLLAIEDGKRNELPERVFLNSFIKKYARVLGVRVDEITDSELIGTNKGSKISGSHFQVYHLYLLVAGVLFVAGLYLILFQNSNHVIAEAPAVEESVVDEIIEPEIVFKTTGETVETVKEKVVQVAKQPVPAEPKVATTEVALPVKLRPNIVSANNVKTNVIANYVMLRSTRY